MFLQIQGSSLIPNFQPILAAIRSDMTHTCTTRARLISHAMTGNSLGAPYSVPSWWAPCRLCADG